MNRERIPRPAGAGLRGKRANLKIRLKVLTVENSLSRHGGTAGFFKNSFESRTKKHIASLLNLERRGRRGAYLAGVRICTVG